MGVSSVTGFAGGFPYTAAVDEKTSRATPASRIPDVLNENQNSGWNCPFEARRKIIDHDGQFATISEFVHHVAPNVSGSTGDKDRHCYRLS